MGQFATEIHRRYTSLEDKQFTKRAEAEDILHRREFNRSKDDMPLPNLSLKPLAQQTVRQTSLSFDPHSREVPQHNLVDAPDFKGQSGMASTNKRQ